MKTCKVTSTVQCVLFMCALYSRKFSQSVYSILVRRYITKVHISVNHDYNNSLPDSLSS